MNERERRIGTNEALFRSVNERIKELNETFAVRSDEHEAVCECGDMGCADWLTVSAEVYERVRADRTLFIVARGHASPDVEDVVEDQPRWQIVRKHSGPPAALAAETDERG